MQYIECVVYSPLNVFVIKLHFLSLTFLKYLLSQLCVNLLTSIPLLTLFSRASSYTLVLRNTIFLSDLIFFFMRQSPISW